ncbi:MAG TPA: hypothetical protein VGQ83_06445 [Polyangia bacterium]|jgi:hypothetical protein
MQRALVIAAAAVLACGIMLLTSAAAAKGLQKADLVGSWRCSGVDFESVNLDGDGTFTSHMNARPFDLGSWQLAGTTLTMKGNSGTTTFKGLKLVGKKLKGTIDGKTATWTKE